MWNRTAGRSASGPGSDRGGPTAASPGSARSAAAAEAGCSTTTTTANGPARRVRWELEHGPLTDTVRFVKQTCGTLQCVSLEHLAPVLAGARNGRTTSPFDAIDKPGDPAASAADVSVAPATVRSRSKEARREAERVLERLRAARARGEALAEALLRTQQTSLRPRR